MMEYKGYAARVEFDDSVKVFHGRVVGIRDVVTFEGTSVEELDREFHDSVDEYLDLCARRGESPEKPYSGKFMVRLDPALHRDAALAAQANGESLNAFIAQQLERAVRAR